MNKNSSTGKLLFGDPLARRRWIKEGSLQAGKTSFWKKFSSVNSFHKPINRVHGLQTDNKGNDIVFDFDGFIAQEPIHNDGQVSGTGTNRRKYSATMKTREFHNSVAVGQSWDLNLIGSVELRKMAKQRHDLLDMRKRITDQAHFDVSQGMFMDDRPSHILFGNANGSIAAGNTMEANIATLGSADRPSLAMLENIIDLAITGEGLYKHDNQTDQYGLDTDRSRPGLTQWTDPGANGEEVQTIDLLVDWYFLRELSKDPGWRKLWTIIHGKSENELFSSNTIQYKNIRLHREPLFKGKTSARALNRTAVEQAGSRRMSLDAGGKLVWEGEDGFQHNTGPTVKQWGMATLIGAGALTSHAAFRPHDEFTVEYNNHKSRKEAALHYYMNVKRARLFEHNGDYHMLKMADYDLGLINIAYSIQG